MAEQTLFDKYGGFSKISKVVMDFYDRLLDSDEIGPFFDDVDMSRMVDHQTKFVASLLGGPAAYTNHQLRQMHSRLEITDQHFDDLKVVLADTLKSHKFADGDIAAVLAEFENRRDYILGRKNVD